MNVDSVQRLHARGVESADVHGNNTIARAVEQQTSPCPAPLTVVELWRIVSALDSQARLMGESTFIGSELARLARKVGGLARAADAAVTLFELTDSGRAALAGEAEPGRDANGETARAHVANAVQILGVATRQHPDDDTRRELLADDIEAVQWRLGRALALLDRFVPVAYVMAEDDARGSGAPAAWSGPAGDDR